MDDERIIALYFERDESAIAETQKKYGSYLFTIANNILHSKEDAEECENDTYLRAWNSIPPQKPNILSAFLGRIARNTSLKRLKKKNAERRGGGEALLSLDELKDCIPSGGGFRNELSESALSDTISAFLRSLPDTERRIFICRYWYCDPISDICRRFSFGESRVKMMLKRTRERLLVHLQKEGVFTQYEKK